MGYLLQKEETKTKINKKKFPFTYKIKSKAQTPCFFVAVVIEYIIIIKEIEKFFALW